MIYITAMGKPAIGKLGVEWLCSALWVQTIVRLIGCRHIMALCTGTTMQKINQLNEYKPELVIEIGLNHSSSGGVIYYNDDTLKDTARDISTGLTDYLKLDCISARLHGIDVPHSILSTINCPWLSIQTYGFDMINTYAGLHEGIAGVIADVLLRHKQLNN